LTAAPNGVSDIEKRYGAAFPREPQTPEDGIVKIVTLAPELDGMMDKGVIKELSRRNINVSIGHTTSGIEDATNAVKNGATLITHLFNAMAPFHHRDPGVIGLLGASNLEKRPYYGIICDGIHTHPNSAMVAYYAHPKGAVLVTDAMGAMGLPYGKYKLGQMDVERTDHGVYITGTDTLAGRYFSILTGDSLQNSDATMDSCVQNFRKFTNCSFIDAVEAATLRPAEVMGIKHFKGTLNPGSDADFLFVDEDLNVYETWIAGERVWNKEESPVQVRSNLVATLSRFKELGKSAPYDDTDDL
jgi:N-acetylglucosamine-6-phosphate deacetylase